LKEIIKYIILLMIVFVGTQIIKKKYEEEKINYLLDRYKTDILLFSSSECPYCIQAKKALHRSRHKFVILEVDKNTEYDSLLVNYLNLDSVPVMLLSPTTKIIGFDEIRYAEELNLYRK